MAVRPPDCRGNVSSRPPIQRRGAIPSSSARQAAATRRREQALPITHIFAATVRCRNPPLKRPERQPCGAPGSAAAGCRRTPCQPAGRGKGQADCLAFASTSDGRSRLRPPKRQRAAAVHGLPLRASVRDVGNGQSMLPHSGHHASLAKTPRQSRGRTAKELSRTGPVAGCGQPAGRGKGQADCLAFVSTSDGRSRLRPPKRQRAAAVHGLPPRASVRDVGNGQSLLPHSGRRWLAALRAWLWSARGRSGAQGREKRGGYS